MKDMHKQPTFGNGMNNKCKNQCRRLSLSRYIDHAVCFLRGVSLKLSLGT